MDPITITVPSDHPLYPALCYEKSRQDAEAAQSQHVQQLTDDLAGESAQLTQAQAQIAGVQEQLAASQNQVAAAQAQIVELTRQQKVQRVIGVAMLFDYEKVPYKFDTTWDHDKTFDCSAFMQIIWKVGADVALPRTSREQATFGAAVTFEERAPGDLFLYDFNHDGRITHVAMYIGDGQIIETNTPATGINIQSDNWNRGAIVACRRPL